MAKVAIPHVCRECGAAHRKWSGRCDACGAWNSIEEDPGLSAAGPAAKTLGVKKGRAVALSPLSGSEAPPPRRSSGIAEFDRAARGVARIGCGLDVRDGARPPASESRGPLA